MSRKVLGVFASGAVVLSALPITGCTPIVTSADVVRRTDGGSAAGTVAGDVAGDVQRPAAAAPAVAAPGPGEGGAVVERSPVDVASKLASFAAAPAAAPVDSGFSPSVPLTFDVVPSGVSSGVTGPTTQATSAPATGPTTVAASEPAEPDRLDLPPAPLDSPPFPSSDWTGPDPLIGTHDSNSQSLIEKLIQNTAPGKFLADNRIRIYGWADLGGNISSSKQSNSPVSYDLIPNQVVLDQLVLRTERVLDTSQTDHVDWGFRIGQLYGTDYRFTTAKGFLSDQLLQHNREYGYDFPEAYAELYLPKIADGFVIKVGRYISPADIEAQLAPQNYTYSHSVTFTFDPYTFTGINTVTKLSKNVTVELGLHGGSDVSPGTSASSLNGLAMLQLRNDSGNDALYGGINSIGTGKYRDHHDDLQQVVAVWGHKFNERFHMQTEVYYLWQFDALKGGTVIDGPPRPFAGSGAGTLIPGRSDAYGFINYFEAKLTDADYLTLRSDVYEDPQGQRTGFQNLYLSETFGLSHNFTPNLTFRPEIRYDRAFQEPAYNNGTRKNQVTASADLIFLF